MSEQQIILKENLPYRVGAIGIIIDDRGRFLVMQTLKYQENQWRFLGGGLDEGETPEGALLRELSEEILGEGEFEILRESLEPHKYDWPIPVIKERIKERGEYFRGQEQHQFLVRFKGDPDNLRPNTKELKAIKWAPYAELKDLFTFPNQWEQAKEVIDELLM